MSRLYNKKNKEQLIKDLNHESEHRITLSFYKYVKLENLVELRKLNINVNLRINIIRVLGKKGFEPLTPWFVATCSSPLSYKPFMNRFIDLKLSGWLGW